MVQSVSFEDGGLVIQYADMATDVRVGGKVFVGHQAHLSAAHPDYAEAADSLHRKVQRILKEALEDFEDSEPFIPSDEDDDEYREMGDGHGAES